MSESPKQPGRSRQIARPHDALFRRVFSEPAQAAALLSETLPAAVRDRFDWNTLRRA